MIFCSGMINVHFSSLCAFPYKMEFDVDVLTPFVVNQTFGEINGRLVVHSKLEFMFFAANELIHKLTEPNPLTCCVAVAMYYVSHEKSAMTLYFCELQLIKILLLTFYLRGAPSIVYVVA